MQAISFLVQIAGLIAAVYVAFTRSIIAAVLLVVIIGVMHFLSTTLSNFLLGVHERTMSDDEKRSLEHMASIGMEHSVIPKAWHFIAGTCAVLFWVAASVAIYAFVVS